MWPQQSRWGRPEYWLCLCQSGEWVKSHCFCRADRVFSALNDIGGRSGIRQYASCPRGQKVVGYSGLATCDGPDLIQVRLPL